MTCIACKDGVLAADRQAFFHGTHNQVNKIWKKTSSGPAFACAGIFSDTLKFREWIEQGEHADRRPTLGEVNGFSALELRPNGQVFVFDGSCVRQEFEAPFFAIGSGAAEALGAMAAGASAIEAVEIACHFDDGCGGGVDSVSVFNEYPTEGTTIHKMTPIVRTDIRSLETLKNDLAIRWRHATVKVGNPDFQVAQYDSLPGHPGKAVNLPNRIGGDKQ